MKRFLTVLALFLLTTASSYADTPRTLTRGVNLPQATFGGGKIPGIPNKDYMWPAPSDVALYGAIGSNLLRVGFLWERMQPQLNGDLQPQELAHLDALVDAAATQNITILIDVHNYGVYGGNVIGSDQVPTSAFADLWTRLAEHYKDKPNVAFGLMNEPNKHGAEEWTVIAQAAIDAIRKTGAQQAIFVPGSGWSGAHSWMDKNGKLSNAEAFTALHDPVQNIVFEAHQYFDADSSGTHPTCVSEDAGVQGLQAFTAWLRQHHFRGFLGEFGASKDPVCLAALKKTLDYMNANNDVWFGWSYWAAAAWFGDYMFNVYPPDPAKFPQVNILKNAMMGADK